MRGGFLAMVGDLRVMLYCKWLLKAIADKQKPR